MHKYNHSISFKAIAMVLVCLFCTNSVVLADPDTLAPPAGNPQTYHDMQSAMESKYATKCADHESSIDKFIRQHTATARSLSSSFVLQKEFTDCVKACNAEAMLNRLIQTLRHYGGGQIQVISVDNEDELPPFEGKRVWGHAGTYVTAFALKDEEKTGAGRGKIIGRLFHEIRARSTRAKELFDEERKKNPPAPEGIGDFIKEVQKKFEDDNLAIETEIKETGRINDPALSKEFANLTFAAHPEVINRDYTMAAGLLKQESSAVPPATAPVIDEVKHLLLERGCSQLAETLVILEKNNPTCILADIPDNPSREQIVEKLYAIAHPKASKEECMQFVRLISVREFGKMTADFKFGPCIIDGRLLVFRYRPPRHGEGTYLSYWMNPKSQWRDDSIREPMVTINGINYCAISLPEGFEGQVSYFFKIGWDVYNDPANPCLERNNNACITIGQRDGKPAILDMLVDEKDPARPLKETILNDFKLYAHQTREYSHLADSRGSLPDVIKKLSSSGAETLLNKLRACGATGLYIEPFTTMKEIEDFLKGDRTYLYERVFLGTLEIKSLKVMRDAIKEVTDGDFSQYDYIKAENLALVIEGMDGPFPDECAKALSGFKKFNQRYALIFQKAYKDYPHHRQLFLDNAYPQLKEKLKNFPELFRTVAEAAAKEDGDLDEYLCRELNNYISSQGRSVAQMLASSNDIQLQQKAVELLIRAKRKGVETNPLFAKFNSRVIPDAAGSRGYVSVLEWFIGLGKEEQDSLWRESFANILEISSWDYSKAIERQRKTKVNAGYFIGVLRCFGNRRGVYDFFKECNDEDLKDKTLESIVSLVDKDLSYEFTAFMDRYRKCSVGQWDLSRFKKIVDWFIGLTIEEQREAGTRDSFLRLCIRHKNILGEAGSGVFSPGFVIVGLIKTALEGKPAEPSEIQALDSGLKDRVTKVMGMISQLSASDTARRGLDTLVRILQEEDVEEEIRILPQHFPEGQNNVSEDNVAVQGNSGQRVVYKEQDVIRNISADEALSAIEAYLNLAEHVTTADSGKVGRSVFEGLSPRQLAALTASMFIRKIEYKATSGLGVMQTTFTQIAEAVRQLARSKWKKEKNAMPPDLRDVLLNMKGGPTLQMAAGKQAPIYENLAAFLAANNLQAGSSPEISGRIIRVRLSDGKLLIIKAVDSDTANLRGETKDGLVSVLLREAAVLSHKNELGLDGRYPQLLKTSLPGQQTETKSDWFVLRNLGTIPVCPGTGRLLNFGTDESRIAIAYICRPESQSYLDDPNQEPNPEPYLIQGIRDRCRLLRHGIVLRNWDGFIHNVQDNRRFDWSFYRDNGEAGTIPSWMERCEFSNWRRLCLMDLEHAEVFSEAENGNLSGIATELGNVVFSAILTCGANFWKQDNYPFKFFGSKHVRFRKFIREAFIAAYEEYCQVPADVLDKMIDWDNLASRASYEMGSLIRQEMFLEGGESRQRLGTFLKKYGFKQENLDQYKDHYATYDLGYGHGVFPIPELIRALWIFTSAAIVERAYQDQEITPPAAAPAKPKIAPEDPVLGTPTKGEAPLHEELRKLHANAPTEGTIPNLASGPSPSVTSVPVPILKSGLTGKNNFKPVKGMTIREIEEELNRLSRQLWPISGISAHPALHARFLKLRGKLEVMKAASSAGSPEPLIRGSSPAAAPQSAPDAAGKTVSVPTGVNDLYLDKAVLCGRGSNAYVYKVPGKDGHLYALKVYGCSLNDRDDEDKYARYARSIEREIRWSSLCPQLIQDGVMPRYLAKDHCVHLAESSAVNAPLKVLVWDPKTCHYPNLCVIMEYVEGKDWYQQLKEWETSAIGAEAIAKNKLELALSLAKTVSAYHQAGLCIKELKPDNLRVRHNGTVCPVDLDLALPLGYDVKKNSLGIDYGTICAVTPLFAESDFDSSSLSVGFNSQWDIYSFGILILHLFDRAPLKRIVEHAETYFVHNHDEMQKEIMGSITAGLNHYRGAAEDALMFRLYEIIAKCTDLDRAKRYQDMGGVIKDLQSCISLVSAPAAQPPAPQPAPDATGKTVSVPISPKDPLETCLVDIKTERNVVSRMIPPGYTGMTVTILSAVGREPLAGLILEFNALQTRSTKEIDSAIKAALASGKSPIEAIQLCLGLLPESGTQDVYIYQQKPRISLRVNSRGGHASQVTVNVGAEKFEQMMVARGFWEIISDKKLFTMTNALAEGLFKIQNYSEAVGVTEETLAGSSMFMPKLLWAGRDLSDNSILVIVTQDDTKIDTYKLQACIIEKGKGPYGKTIAYVSKKIQLNKQQFFSSLPTNILIDQIEAGMRGKRKREPIRSILWRAVDSVALQSSPRSQAREPLAETGALSPDQPISKTPGTTAKPAEAPAQPGNSNQVRNDGASSQVAAQPSAPRSGPEPAKGPQPATPSGDTLKPESADGTRIEVLEKWHKGQMSLDAFIAELATLLRIDRTVLPLEKRTLVFSEKATFDNRLGYFLPKLAKALAAKEPGVRVAVVARSPQQKALIDELNAGKPDNEKIIHRESVAEIMSEIHILKENHTRKCYYFHVKEDVVDADFEWIIPYDITDIARQIIETIGKLCGITEQKSLEALYELALPFKQAA